MWKQEGDPVNFEGRHSCSGAAVGPNSDVYGGVDGTRAVMGVAHAKVEQHLGPGSDPCGG